MAAETAQTDGETSEGRSSMICTELYRQGLISKEIYQADSAFGDTLSKTTMKGYQTWAAPIVASMQRSETFTKVVYVLAKPWFTEMAYQMGMETEDSKVGRTMMKVGIPLAWTIGASNSVAEYALSNDSLYQFASH